MSKFPFQKNPPQAAETLKSENEASKPSQQRALNVIHNIFFGS
jgi:hypothetical protein